MSKLLPIPQALLAGALAALATGILIWLFSVSGLFIVLGIPIAAPPDSLPWLLARMMWGALAGLIFLAPLLGSMPQWKRGLLVAWIPIAVLLLVVYPRGHEGLLGLQLGIALPITAVVAWLLWGLIAGRLLDRWHAKPAAEDMELPQE